MENLNIRQVLLIFHNLRSKIKAFYNYKGFFNKSATKFFLNKTKTVLHNLQIHYSCKSTFDAIMNETRFLLHGHQWRACRSSDVEPHFWRFSGINRPIRTKFINRRWLVGIDRRLEVAPQAIV